MAQNQDHTIQKYAPEVQQATGDIIRQLPPDINTLALQAKIAEAIVARSEAKIVGAINEALAYRPSPAPAPVQQPQNIRTGDINIKIDCSQNINYWQDNSQTITDNSRHNYWADNSRRYTDNSDHSSHSSYEDNSIDSGIIGALASFWPIALALLVALALSSPCAQQIQQQQRQQQQEFQGGTAL